jgi:hypothetical protein
MANEAVIIELINGGCPIRYTCDNATAVVKGTLMKVTDPRTCAASTAANEPFIGVAAQEKVASDGQTSLAVYTNGIFDLKDNGAGSAVGLMVSLAGANTFATSIGGDLLDGSFIGMNLETAGAAEVCAVRIHK